MQMSARARFILVDPSLRDIRGHHYELAANIAHGAIAEGYDVLWLVHREFPVSACPDNVIVHAVFSKTMYDDFVVSVKNDSRSHGMFSSVRRKLQWWRGVFRHKANLMKFRIFGPGSSGDLSQAKNHGKRTIDDELMSIMSQESISSQDHIIIHTADGRTYSAILDLLLKNGIDSLPYVHLCTPYDSSTMPHQNNVRPVRRVIDYINDLGAIDRKVFLYGENDLLAVELGKWFGCRVDALNLPPPRMAKDAVVSREFKSSLTVAYLGAAREEKGFLLLPEIVAALSETHGKSGRIRFVIQCSPQIIGYKPSIVDAITKLKKFPKPYVELREKAQTTEEYYAMLHEADVVMTCYDAGKYKYRGSGIAVEAVSMGKILLATANTFPAYLADNGCAIGATIDEYIAALNDIVLNAEVYRQTAMQNAAKYRERYSAEKYISRLLERSSEARSASGHADELVRGSQQANNAGNSDKIPSICVDHRQVLWSISGRQSTGQDRRMAQLLGSVQPAMDMNGSCGVDYEYGSGLDALLCSRASTDNSRSYEIRMI